MAQIHDGDTQMIVGNVFSEWRDNFFYLIDGPSSGEWKMTILVWENAVDL